MANKNSQCPKMGVDMRNKIKEKIHLILFWFVHITIIHKEYAKKLLNKNNLFSDIQSPRHEKEPKTIN